MLRQEQESTSHCADSHQPFLWWFQGASNHSVYVTLRVKTLHRKYLASHMSWWIPCSLFLLCYIWEMGEDHDTWYSKWLNDFRWKICTFLFSFYETYMGFCIHFSCALLGSEGQEHQISFRRKCLRWAVGHWNSSPGVEKWEWTPFLPGMEVGCLSPALGWLGKVLFLPC